MAQFDIIS